MPAGLHSAQSKFELSSWNKVQRLSYWHWLAIAIRQRRLRRLSIRKAVFVVSLSLLGTDWQGSFVLIGALYLCIPFIHLFHGWLWQWKFCVCSRWLRSDLWWSRRVSKHVRTTMLTVKTWVINLMYSEHCSFDASKVLRSCTNFEITIQR